MITFFRRLTQKLNPSSAHQPELSHSHVHHSHEHCAHHHGHEHDQHSHNLDHGSRNHHSHNHVHHGHSHGLLHHHGPRDGNRQGLIIALLITGTIMLLEFIGGLVTSSLALLSDSGHMLSDSSSLILSLIAFWFSAKAASNKRTFGNHRFEIIATLFNAITLFIVAGLIVIEAIERFLEPTEVSSGTMIIIASIGLIANLLSAYVLMKKGDVEHNVNMRSAYLHVIGDMLGSIGAIMAGIIMLAFNWYYADPIISVVVALLILRSAWSVLKLSLHILMEGAPNEIDSEKLKRSLLAIPHVKAVHDLHIWTITSGILSLSCHLVVEEACDQQAVLAHALKLINEQYGINHPTIQIETANLRHEACPFAVIS